MTTNSRIPKRKFRLRLGLVAFGAAILIGSPVIFSGTAGVLQRKVKNPGMLTNYDIRITGQPAMVELLKSRAPALGRGVSILRRTADSISNLRAQKPDFEIQVSKLTGSAETVENKSGGLTAPAPGGDGIEIVREFMRSNADTYGITSREVDNLRFIGESLSPSGLRMVRFEQMVNGIPVFQSETRAILAEDGRLVRTLGLLVGGSESADPLTDLISPKEALGAAMQSVGMSVDPSQMSVANTDGDGNTAVVNANNKLIKAEVPSKLVYFPAAPGVLIPAWSQITFTRGDRDWYTIVDAQKGSLLWRKNIRADASTHDARFRVYVQADGKTPADSPAPHSPTTNTIGLGTQYAEIFPTIVSMLAVQDATASPNGWIDDCPGGGCTTNETQTIGNNVHAYMDAQGGANNNVPDSNAAFMLDGNGKPIGNPDTNGRNRDFLGTTLRDFQTNFLPPPQAGNPEAGQTCTGNGSSGTLAIDQFRRGVVTQLFYVTNWYHDQLYNLGFNEAAGNYQVNNFARGGLGNDRVLAEAEDNQSTNNANFATPPDGTSGRAQMFRFTGPTIDRDGDLDSEVLVHEMTHGVSNRLIGNAAGLNWDIG